MLKIVDPSDTQLFVTIGSVTGLVQWEAMAGKLEEKDGMVLSGKVDREIGIGGSGKGGPSKGSPVIIFPWAVTQCFNARQNGRTCTQKIGPRRCALTRKSYC